VCNKPITSQADPVLAHMVFTWFTFGTLCTT